MTKLLHALAASAAAAVLITGVIAGSARIVRAQEAADWQHVTQGPAIAQPAARPPLDLTGCWSGSIDDHATGVGTGFLFFVQSGRKLTTGTNGALNFSGGSSTGGALTGSTGPVSFQLKHHQKNCQVSFHGRMSSSDLVGTYHLNKGCGVKARGTFEYTFDNTGATCP